MDKYTGEEEEKWRKEPRNLNRASGDHLESTAENP